MAKVDGVHRSVRHQHHWPGHDASDRTFFARAEALGLRVEASQFAAQPMLCLFEEESTPVFLHRLTWAAGSGSGVQESGTEIRELRGASFESPQV